MKIRAAYPSHLTYCMNVHPGESLTDVCTAIENHAVAIRNRVAPESRFGLGLRLANRASLELVVAGNLARLKRVIEKHGCYAFTINGFPFGAFHGARVKEEVYRPDWRSNERRDYTHRLARQLAALLPEGMTGSISTVPGSYKAWVRSDADITDMVAHLAETVVFLAKLQQETGREVHLGLEPEPDCFLETTDETITFFRDGLLPEGRTPVARLLGCSEAAAEAAIRRHVGVCFDTCHLALQFESLSESLKKLSAAEIRISKIQLSAAIQTRWDPDAAEALKRFCDPVYLHQVKACVDGRGVSRGDLEEALRSRQAQADEAWRVHCHVPLYFVGEGALSSTANELDAAFFQTARDLRVEHFEIETYTFDVLPESLRTLGVNASIAQEYQWALARLVGDKRQMFDSLVLPNVSDRRTAC